MNTNGSNSKSVSCCSYYSHSSNSDTQQHNIDNFSDCSQSDTHNFSASQSSSRYDSDSISGRESHSKSSSRRTTSNSYYDVGNHSLEEIGEDYDGHCLYHRHKKFVILQ